MRRALFLILMVFLVSCGNREIIEVKNKKRLAQLDLKIKWPQKERKALKIPLQTSKLNLFILSGYNIIFQEEIENKGEKEIRKTYLVPFGEIGIVVEAKDEKGNILSKGSVFKFLYPKETWQISLDLEEPLGPSLETNLVELKINQVFTSDFPKVILLDSILDQNQNPLTDFNLANFKVYEDGIEAVVLKVELVSKEEGISVVLILDRSGSMVDATLDLNEAATEFVNLLQLYDKVGLVEFNSSVYEDFLFTSCDLSRINSIELTQDKELVINTINQTKEIEGCTPLFDAIFQGVELLKFLEGRKAIVLISDGAENFSDWYQDIEELIYYLEIYQIPIFSIGLPTEDFYKTIDRCGGLTGDECLSYISYKTGGVYYKAPSSTELKEIYNKISSTLKKQIKISYVTPFPTILNETREVEVELKYGDFSTSASTTYFF